MSVVTVNGASAASLGIEDITIRLNNQDVDVAEVLFASDYNANLPAAFSENAMVAIAVDGTQIFYGRCAAPRRNALSGAESIAVDILGPWSDLSDIPYTALMADPVSGANYTTGRTMLGPADFTAFVQYEVDTAIGHGAALTRGIVDLPAMTIPRFAANDASIASCIRETLKWCPGAVVFFNYSTTPPTLHCLQPGSLSLQTIAAPGDSASYALRSDLVPAGVRITYERPHVIIRRQNLEGNGIMSKTENIFTHVETDQYPAGFTGSRRELQVSTILGGSKEYTFHEHKFNASGNLALSQRIGTDFGFYPYIGALIYETGGHTAMVAASYGSWSGTIDAPNAATPFCVGRDLRYETLAGAEVSLTPAQWFVIINRSDKINWSSMPEVYLLENAPSGFAFRRVRLTSRWSATGNGAATYTHTHNFVVGNYNSGSLLNRTMTVSRDTTSDVLSPAPQNAAQAIMSSLGTAFYEGSLTVPVGEISLFKRAVVVGATRCPVQRVFLSLGTEMATLTFGPPTQLRPADFIGLFMAGS